MPKNFFEKTKIDIAMANKTLGVPKTTGSVLIQISITIKTYYLPLSYTQSKEDQK